jgi:ABC-type Na+ efflux pump permease subunit
MRSTVIVYLKEMVEILRDRRTLMAIGLSAIATPLVLSIVTRVSTQTATQTYTVGYSGQVPVGLDTLMQGTGLKLEAVDDPQAAAKHDVDLGVMFEPGSIDEYYDPTRQGAEIADTRLATASRHGAPAELSVGRRRQRFPELLPSLHPDHDDHHGRLLGRARQLGG